VAFLLSDFNKENDLMLNVGKLEGKGLLIRLMNKIKTKTGGLDHGWLEKGSNRRCAKG